MNDDGFRPAQSGSIIPLGSLTSDNVAIQYLDIRGMRVAIKVKIIGSRRMQFRNWLGAKMLVLTALIAGWDMEVSID